jgi:hypothetical protein
MEVLRCMRDRDEREICVVLCSDGMLGISCDGVLLPSLEWPQKHMDDCIAFATRFAQTSPPRNDPDGDATHSLGS